MGKHGMYNTVLYRRWSGIKDRCTNRNKNSWVNYGGKGIKVCHEWLDDFMNFYNWSMSNGFHESLVIDRINGDGDYCPENCRWVSVEVNCKNKPKRNRHIKYNWGIRKIRERYFIHIRVDGRNATAYSFLNEEDAIIVRDLIIAGKHPAIRPLPTKREGYGISEAFLRSGVKKYKVRLHINKQDISLGWHWTFEDALVAKNNFLKTLPHEISSKFLI